MTDLATRILAAIDAAEALARTAELHAPGPWRNESWTESPLPHAEGICEANGDGIAAVRGSYVSDFIMANQPKDILRRCASDRQIVTLCAEEYAAGMDNYDMASAILPLMAEKYGIDP